MVFQAGRVGGENALGIYGAWVDEGSSSWRGKLSGWEARFSLDCVGSWMQVWELGSRLSLLSNPGGGMDA